MTDVDNAWQLSTQSLIECNRYMLEHQIACDAKFLVGEDEEERQEVEAHKYVLISRSPVFYTMFYGEMRTLEGETVVINDIDPSAFRLFLRYLYCDETDFNEENVLSMLYASRKYMLPALTQKCVKYLEANLSPENVLVIYEHSILYEIESLIKKCETFVQTRTNDVLKAQAFLEVPAKSLKRILKFRKLASDELTLFNICNSWAKEECIRQDIEPSMENRRVVLGDILYLLHLPALPLRDFANVVSRANLLTAEEKCEVYDYMAADDTSDMIKNMKFPTRKRSKPKFSILRRFTNFSKGNVYSGDCSIMRLQCDQAIVFKGIGIHGSTSHDPLSEVQLVIKQDKTSICNRTMCVQDNRSGETLQVVLDETVILKPQIWYSIIATYHFFGETDQGCCKKGKGGFKSHTADDVTFEFDRNDAAGHIVDLLYWKV